MSVIASDDFNRANQNPLAAPWLVVGLQLLNHQVVATTTNNFGIASYDAITWPSDHSSQAILKNAVANSGAIQLLARIQASFNDWYTFYIPNVTTGIGQGGAVHIGKVVSGVLQPSIADGGVNLLSIGDVFKFQAKGANLTAYQNGNLILSGTDSTFSGGKPGLAINTTFANQVSDLAWGPWVGSSIAGSGLLQSYGVVKVITPGTPTQVAMNPINCNAIYFQALSTNTGKIYIGLAGLNKSTLANNLRVLLPPPAAAVTLDSWNPQALASHGPINLNTIFIDADNTGEGVEIAYLVG